MAGRGPAPKESRRRANRPARGEWVDLPPLERVVLRDLPEGEWPVETLEMWAAWQADPVSTQWSSSDVEYAVATARIHASGPISRASEIRLRMDSLGLTPKGKRDLRWRIQAVKVAEVEQPAAEVRRLRAVDAG